MKLNRRRFIGFGAGAAAGTALGVPVSRTLSSLVEAAEEPVYPPSGTEDFVLSVCKLCPGGCGLRVRRVGGRPVKVDGNPLHPVNAGRLCPKGQAALQSLYHPDRIAGPMRRIGPPGSLESFQPASWEQALGEIAERLKLLRQVGRPESLALMRGPSRGMGARVARRFLQAFGSPNDIAMDRGEETAAMALFLGQGVRQAPAYDLQSTDYVLSFGAALLEAWSSPVYMTRAYGEFRQGRPGRRGKLVQVESRLSITGSSADEWIDVRPGTEGTLALGIAQVLVAEGLYNRDFVNLRTIGFESYRDDSRQQRPGVRDFLERDYGLEQVATETGVSNNVILRLAREFAAARSQLAVPPRRGPLLPGTLFDHLAVQLLNALVGNLDGVGGTLVPEESPLLDWPELPDDPTARAGRSRPRIDRAGSDNTKYLESDPEGFAEAVLANPIYPIDVLLILGTDPVFASPAPAKFAQDLEKINMVVSFASLPDDTALHADWILPEAHFLEAWELDGTPPGVAFPVVSLGKPVTEETLHDVRPAAEIFLDLAGKVGQEVAAAFPASDLVGLIRADVDRLYGAKRGTIMGTEFDEAWVRMMERAGWWAPGYRSTAELWRRMQESGGWWDPFYDHGNWRRVFQTPSNRFEFRGDLLHQLAAERKPPSAHAGEGMPGGGQQLLPLYLYEPLPVAGGVGAELPFLQELLDPGLEQAWETWAEIHPQTAEHLGVRDHDHVRITSEQGFIEVPARVTPRVVEGAVAIPVGLGKTGGGRWASGVGANPLRLMSAEREPLSGLPDLGTTRVWLSIVARPASGRMARRS